MIEYSLCCDECGAIIVASKTSAAEARTLGRLMCTAGRHKRRDLCCRCIGPAPSINQQAGDDR